MEVSFYCEKERRKKNAIFNTDVLTRQSSAGHLKMHRVYRLCLCIICRHLLLTYSERHCSGNSRGCKKIIEQTAFGNRKNIQFARSTWRDRANDTLYDMLKNHIYVYISINRLKCVRIWRGRACEKTTKWKKLKHSETLLNLITIRLG